ncbi:hypothetical protein N7448_010945 [Penicillium atrosanguineum]|nr:hypothetical protein N7448_010945 [Penicillium atrosanguineum]
MKTSICSDAWEKNKALITKLYMGEEWPLKHVIKKIRSEGFKPSETQLRSRLKKWRITKPSRQTRRGPRTGGLGDDGNKEDMKRSSIPPSSNDRPLPAAKETPNTRSNWSEIPVCAPSDLQCQLVDEELNTPVARQLTPSSSVVHVPVSDKPHTVHNFPDLSPHTISFEQPFQIYSAAENLMANITSAAAPSYPGYTLFPESCNPSPRSTTTPAMATWPPRPVSVDPGLNFVIHPGQWYHTPFEAINSPSGVPHSATVGPSARYRDQIPMVAPPPLVPYLPEFAYYGVEAPEFHNYNF